MVRLAVSNDLRVAVAYGTTSFSATLLNTIFNLFYVDLYLQLYGLSSAWFFGGWNLTNTH